MISLTEKDIEQLRYIGTGSFGTVYQKDDKTAYKIYHKLVPDMLGRPTDNPALDYPRHRFNLLKKKAPNLQYTEVYKDIIYIDGKFGGIAIPYYDGKTLNNFQNSNYLVKMDISKQLVRNGKELIDNYIYPLDYKLNNIMYCNGKVRIIDLDDYYTHVHSLPNIFHKKESIQGLGETITALFEESPFRPIHYSLRKELQKLNPSKIKYSYQLEDIEEYIQEKELQRDYLIIDEESDLSTITQLLSTKPYRIIYTYRIENINNDFFWKEIQKLKKAGIQIYDMISIDFVYDYLNNYNIGSCLEVHKSYVKRQN